MAIRLASAFVELFSRDQQLREGLSRTRQDINTTINELSIASRAIAAFAATAAVAFTASAVKAAANAEEIQSKFEAVFKDLSNDAENFAKDFAENIGRSAIETKRQLAEFQDTFVPLGFARDRAAELAKQMVALTADLASFNNIADSDAQARLTSALVGNHEAVRGFGVIITQATLEQELFNMGIEGGVKAATEQEKVMARLAIVMKSTTDAQGDAERTAGSFTNQMKALQGQLADLSAELGAVMLPTLTEFVSLASGAIETFSTLNKTLGGFPAKLAVVTGAILTLSVALRAAGVSAKFMWRSILGPLGIAIALFEVGFEVAKFIDNTLTGKKDEVDKAAKKARDAAKDAKDAALEANKASDTEGPVDEEAMKRLQEKRKSELEQVQRETENLTTQIKRLNEQPLLREGFVGVSELGNRMQQALIDEFNRDDERNRLLKKQNDLALKANSLLSKMERAARKLEPRVELSVA